MHARLIKIGNSKGVRISKTLIDQYSLNEEITIEPTNKGILISSRSTPRQGWEEQFKTAGKTIDKTDEWNSVPNKFDEDEWKW